MKKSLLAAVLLVLLCGCVPKDSGQQPTGGTLPRIVTDNQPTQSVAEPTQQPSDNMHGAAEETTDASLPTAATEAGTQPPTAATEAGTQPPTAATEAGTQPATPPTEGSTSWTGSVDLPPDIFD